MQYQCNENFNAERKFQNFNREIPYSMIRELRILKCQFSYHCFTLYFLAYQWDLVIIILIICVSFKMCSIASHLCILQLGFLFLTEFRSQLYVLDWFFIGYVCHRYLLSFVGISFKNLALIFSDEHINFNFIKRIGLYSWCFLCLDLRNALYTRS